MLVQKNTIFFTVKCQKSGAQIRDFEPFICFMIIYLVLLDKLCCEVFLEREKMSRITVFTIELQ